MDQGKGRTRQATRPDTASNRKDGWHSVPSHGYSNVIVKYLRPIQVLKSSHMVGVVFSSETVPLGAAGCFQSGGYELVSALVASFCSSG